MAPSDTSTLRVNDTIGKTETTVKEKENGLDPAYKLNRDAVGSRSYVQVLLRASGLPLTLPDRLDYQHKWFVGLCESNLIHPSIPKENIQTVADVAMGTGYVMRVYQRGLVDEGG